MFRSRPVVTQGKGVLALILSMCLALATVVAAPAVKAQDSLPAAGTVVGTVHKPPAGLPLKATKPSGAPDETQSKLITVQVGDKRYLGYCIEASRGPVGDGITGFVQDWSDYKGRTHIIGGQEAVSYTHLTLPTKRIV